MRENMLGNKRKCCAHINLAVKRLCALGENKGKWQEEAKTV